MEKAWEDALERLEKRVAADEAQVAIATVIHRFLLYLQGADINGALRELALERDDVLVEIDRGCLRGGSAVREGFEWLLVLARLPGAVIQHEAASLTVTVADDGASARVTAFSPGYKALAQADSQVWSLGKWFFELVPVDDGWKILHMQWSVLLEADAEMGWLFQNRSHLKETTFAALDELHATDRLLQPPQNVIDYYKYDELCYPLPEPPAPYQSGSETSILRNTRGY